MVCYDAISMNVSTLLTYVNTRILPNNTICISEFLAHSLSIEKSKYYGNGFEIESGKLKLQLDW